MASGTKALKAPRYEAMETTLILCMLKTSPEMDISPVQIDTCGVFQCFLFDAQIVYKLSLLWKRMGNQDISTQNLNVSVPTLVW